MSGRRYYPGRRFDTEREAVGWVLRDNHVYMGHKFYHNKWVRNWSITQIARAINFHMLSRAHPIRSQPDHDVRLLRTANGVDPFVW